MIKNTIIFLGLLFVSLYGQPEYDIMLLPHQEEKALPAPDGASWAYREGANSQGIIVGLNRKYCDEYYGCGGPQRVLVYDPRSGEGYDLLDSFGLSDTEGFSIKRSRVIKDVFITEDNHVIFNANFRTYIYNLDDKTVSSLALDTLIAVNAKGQMTGVSWFFDPQTGVHELGTFDKVEGYGVWPDLLSSNGTVAGTGFDAGLWRGFIWNQDYGLKPMNIPTEWLTVNGINDKNSVVGYFEPEGQDDEFKCCPDLQAYFFTLEKGFLDLGTLGGSNSYAWSINNSNQVVGTSEISTSTEEFLYQRAFIWDVDHGMRDLTTLIPENTGWTRLEEAYEINDSGNIVGEGQFKGNSHKFLLVPRKP